MYLSKKRITVTGGKGFLGTYLGVAITEYRIHRRLLSIATDSKMLVHNKIRDDFFMVL